MLLIPRADSDAERETYWSQVGAEASGVWSSVSTGGRVMFAFRKLAAASAAIGDLLLVGAVVSPAAASPGGGVHADPPGEVIRYPIYERNFNGLWANDRFSGSCPTTHPYLTDKRFSNDRILPAGVIVTTASSVATLVVATSSETRIEGKKEFRRGQEHRGILDELGTRRGKHQHHARVHEQLEARQDREPVRVTWEAGRSTTETPTRPTTPERASIGLREYFAAGDVSRGDGPTSS